MTSRFFLAFQVHRWFHHTLMKQRLVILSLSTVITVERRTKASAIPGRQQCPRQRPLGLPFLDSFAWQEGTLPRPDLPPQHSLPTPCCTSHWAPHTSHSDPWRERGTRPLICDTGTKQHDLEGQSGRTGEVMWRRLSCSFGGHHHHQLGTWG